MMQKIKYWIYGIIVVIILSLGFTSFTLGTRVSKLNSELITAISNIKAFESENDRLVNNNMLFTYTIDQLNYSNDSLIQVLNDLRKELKIKDRNIQELQYIASINRKQDTLFIRDTIFKDPTFIMDTLVADQWASLNLHLSYPNEITADYSFKNETVIISSSKKETVNPPKKCGLFRLFQKKHTVTEVEVIQNNPYCENDLHKHIKIIN